MSLHVGRTPEFSQESTEGVRCTNGGLIPGAVGCLLFKTVSGLRFTKHFSHLRPILNTI